jgi:hypothetical protein
MGGRETTAAPMKPAVRRPARKPNSSWPLQKETSSPKATKVAEVPPPTSPHYATQAIKACQAGFTDRELGALFGVSEATINNWKLKHEDFARALKAAKAPADDRVERSLYARANGYEYDGGAIRGLVLSDIHK